MARRVRRAYRRFRARAHHRHKQGMFSKVTSVVALLIGSSPIIQEAKNEFVDGLKNPVVFAERSAMLYVPYNFETKQFDTSKLAVGYGAILGAVLFKKAMGYLNRVAKF